MADSYRPSPLSPISPVGDRYRPRSHGGAADSGAFADTPQDPSRGHDAAAVSASVLGIPPEEMTDAVRNALNTLLEDLSRLRQDVERLMAHEAYLDQIDHHCEITSALNRRGLAREINRATTRMAAPDGVGGTLVLLQLIGSEVFRDAHGLAASLAAQKHAAAALTAATRQSDLVTNLGGGDLAVFLALTHGEEAEIKAGVLADALNHPPLHWNGQPHAFTIAFGLSALSPSSTLDSLLEEADVNRRPANAR